MKFLSLIFLLSLISQICFAQTSLSEKSLSQYLQRFPGTRDELYFENQAPQIPQGQRGHKILGEIKKSIFSSDEMPGLKDSDHFLILGSAWIFFDAPIETVYKYLSTVTHAEYPAPVTGTADVKVLDQEHQSYTAFLKNAFMGVNLEQVCPALLTSRMTSSSTSDNLYQFENCTEKGDSSKVWAREVFNRDHLIATTFEGRRATLFLFQNYTVFERHRKVGIKLSKDMILDIAASSALDGFKTIMKGVPAQR